MIKQRESPETKIIWGIGRFIKRLFKGGKSAGEQAQIDREEVKQRWQKISQSLKAGPQNFQIAVINADKLLDYCLQRLGVAGNSMGERLQNASHLFRDKASYQAAWDAHKARNSLVHQHENEFLFHQAKETLEQFHKALEGINVL